MTGRVSGIVSVMDSKGFSVQPHKIRHGNMVNSTGMADVFLGDLVTAARSWKTSSSGAEFSDKNNLAISIEVESLTRQVDNYGAAGLGLRCGEAGQK